MSANPFDEFQRAPDPFDEFQRAAPPVGAVLQTAVKTNPDDMAEAARLAKRYPAPLDAIYRNLPAVRFNALAADAEAQLATTTALREYLASRPHVAGMAHDDIPKLKEIESGLGKVSAAAAGQAVLGISESIWRTPDVAQRAVGYLAETVERTGLPRYLNPIRGVQDVLRFVSEGRAPIGPKMFAGTTDVADQINTAQDILTDRATFGNAFADVQTLAQNADQALAAAIKTGNAQQVGQVLTDPNYWAAFMSQAVPSLYAAMKSGGSVAFMGWLEGMEQASNAAEFEKRTGQKISDAEFTQAVAQTAIANALLEKYGLDKVLGAKGNGLKGIVKAIFSEGGTEALQQVNSNLAAMLAYNPEQSLSEGVLSSLMGGMASGGGVSTAQQGAQRVQTMLERQRQQQRAATEDADRLKALLGAAGQSLLRERSPEDFRAYLQTLGDKPLYVEGEVLNQLPPEVLNQLPESVREQIAPAVAGGGFVEIPVADALTVAPGTPLEQALVENARTDPFALSQAEAKAAGEQAAKLLETEAARVLAEAADQAAMQASSDAVRASILSELNTAARYRPAVNEQMAAWATAFYTTMAARTGMTPEQFYQRYRLRVLGEPSATAAGPVMDQVPAPDGALRGDDGQPLKLYHGTSSDFTKFERVEGGNAYGPGFYFTTDPAEASGYADGTGGGRIAPNGNAGPNVMPVYTTARNVFALDDRVLSPEEIGALESASNALTPNTWTPGELAQVFDRAYPATAQNVMQYIAQQTGAQYTDIAKAAGYDALRGQYGYVVFDPKQIVSAISGEVLGQPAYQQAVNETAAELLIQHNLSAENLLHAKRMGGIPVPSLAVTKKSAPMENFGEITLLGTKDMADPKGYAGAKVFGADIYSPRYPSVEFNLDNKAQRAMNEVLAPFRQEGDRELYGSEVRRPDDITSYKPFRRWAADRYGTTDIDLTWQQLKESASALMRQIGAKERIFQGFTYSGNRKYIDHTLDNVVKILKKELRGGENFNYGVGSLRAKFTPQFRSVAQIKKAKNRLVDRATFESIKKEINDEFIALSEDLGLSLEQTSEVVEDAAKMGAKRAIDRAFKDYKRAEYEATDEQAIAVGDFARKLVNLPTEYFEAKILRAVDVAEFAAAVVPANVSQEVLDALTERGVARIAKYDPNTPGDRAAKVNEFNDLFFQERNGQQQPRGTFNPRSLELVLNPNANLSTWFHETGHFFLEVLADIGSQPDAPPQIAEDYATVLKWFGVTAEQWAGFDLEAKRQYHERWAESVEQYVMEGKAPSAELAPLMRRFAAWLKSVYGSIKRFLAMRGVASAQGGEVLGQGARRFSSLRGMRPTASYVDATPRQQATLDAIDAGPDSTDFDLLPAKEDINTSADAHFTDWERDPGIKYVSLEVLGPLTGYDNAKDKARIRKLADTIKSSNTIEPIFVGIDPNGEAYIMEGQHRARALQLLGETHIPAQVIVSMEGTEDDYAVLPEQPQPEPTDYKAVPGQGTLFQGNQPTGPNLQLNNDIRRVMDRMLATDEQIAQAEEIAGMTPSPEATDAAAEALRKRSMRDLAWSVKTRDEVIKQLQKRAKQVAKAVREQVAAEVNAMPEARAKAALDALAVDTEYDGALGEWEKARAAAEAAARAEVTDHLIAAEEAKGQPLKGLKKGQFLAKTKAEITNKVEARMIEWERENKRPTKARYATEQDLATIADSFGFETVDGMLQAIDAFDRRDLIDGMTDKRMLEEHGDLIDDRAIAEAANEAVHSLARQRVLASELRTQAELLGERADTGRTNAKGQKITTSVIVEAAKQFGAQVVARTPLRDLKAAAWKHTAAERRASKRYTEMTAAGKTLEAVEAKRDQVLQNAAAKAALEAAAEAKKIREFFARVAKGNDETVVEKGRDPDIVNAARAVLAAYGVQTPTTKRAADYLALVEKNDPETHGVIAPMVEAATQNAQPLDALTYEDLVGLHEAVEAMWHLAKRSRQSEVDGKLIDRQELADELFARMEAIGIPDRIPGEGQAVTKAEERALFLRQGVSFLRRVEQWAESMDGKYGGPFLRYVFQPIKDAADRYRTDRVAYRKKLQALVDGIAPIVGDQTIDAPELGYTFGAPGTTKGTAMNEVLHAILHTGNESNKRKLLLGRGWATENADGTLDTGRWDAFIQRLANEGKLQREHFDFVQGVWDLLEETKPLAQQAHRDAFGRFFSEVTADAFVDPFGVPRRGGYAPAIVDPAQVKDNELRKLAEAENEKMTFAFPQPNKGFTQSRVESYTRPLLLDLRTLGQHIDKVLLFSHMTVPARDVRKLLTDKKVSQPLERIAPAAIGSMLQPWLQRSAQQIVETPIVGAGKWARVPSVIRARAGAALMFANVSNAIQQATGLLTALVKVRPSYMTRAVAQHVAHPIKAAQAVWDASAYMNDRAKNEVAVMNEQMQDILLKPGVYERAQNWSMRHAYFLQTAIDNALSPIVWTGAYNQAMAEGMTHDDAVRFADGTVRQTQGSTLPEDVSRFETGPAYARAFTQFVGYFNTVANTNATALKQIAGEVGLKRGAGAMFYIVMLGLLAPIWAAEAIALAFKGGPDDEDDDGYLDDWLAAVFGFGTVKGLLAMIPIAGQAANTAVTRLDNNPMNDRISLSPGLSLLESALGGNVQTAYELLDEDKEVNARRAVRDAATLVSVFTGLPAYALARPLGYAAGVADGRIEPTGPADVARGLLTGAASPESKQ